MTAELSVDNAKRRNTKSTVVNHRSNEFLPQFLALPEGRIDSYSVEFPSSEEWSLLSVMTIKEVAQNSVASTPDSCTDPMLGNVKHSDVCPNCHFTSNTCPGETGIIPLNCYVINPLEEVEKTVIAAMNCLCSSCGKPVVSDHDDSDPHIMWHKNLKDMSDKSKGIVCHRTGCKGSAYDFDKDSTKIPGYIGDMDLKLAHAILSDLSLEDLKMIGYDNFPGPASLIISVIPVNPTRNRAPTQNHSGYLEHSDYTNSYNAILEASQKVAECVNEKERKDAITNLHKKLVAHNELFKETLTDKITGLLRGRQEGKPINNSNRSVIAPAPWLPVTHLSIPHLLAKKATIKCVVTEENIEFINEMMQKGEIRAIYTHGFDIQRGQPVYPGKSYKISIGDSVDRYVVDGDMVFNNRQPTLQEAAIVPRIAVISDPIGEKSKNYLVRLLRQGERDHVTCITLPDTVPKAGDFDGDEMTIYFSQSEDGTKEMQGIQNIENYMIDGQTQKVAFAPVQDALLGIYVATVRSLPTNWKDGTDYEPSDLQECPEVAQKYSYIEPEMLMDYVTMLDSPMVERNFKYSDILRYEDGEFSGDFVDRLRKHDIPLVVDGVIPGLNLLSLILPRNMSFENSECTIRDGVVIKTNGSGISAKSVGNNSECIIDHIVNYHSRAEAVNFVTDCTWIFTSYIGFRGFSIGMGDCSPADKITQAKIDAIAVDLYAKMEMDSVLEPSDEDQAGISLFYDNYEKLTSEATSKSHQIVRKSIDPNNGLLTIIKSGAKGKEGQLLTLISCVGQKYEMGDYFYRTLAGGTRRNYFHSATDTDPISYGFCPNSLARGVTPSESDSIQRSTRGDFVTLSKKTPEVGQESRESSVVSMGMMVGEKGEIRDSIGMISPLFGADGINPMRFSRVKGKIRVVSIEKLYKSL